MSLWKELYDILDKERTNTKKSKANKQALLFEVDCNARFLASAIESKFTNTAIALGMEKAAFEKALGDSFDFNQCRIQTLSSNTIGQFKEFKKYVNKDTQWLVYRAYLRINLLSRLLNADPNGDHQLKIKTLFRYLVIVNAHLHGTTLKRKTKR